MKKKIQFIVLFMLTLSACKKETVVDKEPVPVKENITISEALDWLSDQSDTSAYIKKYPIRLDDAKSVSTSNGNRIVIPIPGQPTYQNTKQGYRQLSIEKDIKTNKIEGKFLEIIPDALYFQAKQKVDVSDFTGRIFVYNLNYSLEKGAIFKNGKQIGESRPSTKSEKLAFAENKTQLPLLATFEQNRTSANGKIALARMIEACVWLQTSYVDAEGIFTIYAEKYCEYYYLDDGGGGGNYNDSGINYETPSGGGGGGSTSAPAPPAASNIPGENNNNVDPKKMVECFGNVPSTGAAFQVKVLVVEPMPGTFFNVGPNSFGHVAIQLTKVNGDKSVTQTLGFYGSGSGLDKLISPSTIKDNGDIEYNMDASYFTDAGSFQKILDYVSNPPKDYHFTDFNCAAFVYNAAKAGNLPVPNPTTTFGFGGPGGVGSGMSPAGWGSALRSEMKANPNSHNISEGGGTAPASKGECK
ncbi:hypothetical protein ACFOWA_19355 [Pedobacter lithocola]|uniref:DUF4105 domain-containing protein n=1 Tax=Pedobacter lithocola TaxID=1908239 RepID=A0ABV8PH07_9SPHI